MSDEQIHHLDELLRIYQRRMRFLEKQAAAYGLHVPPEISIEVEDLQVKIAQIEAKITVPMRERKQRQDNVDWSVPAPTMINPFGYVGRITDPALFFGRDDLLRQIFEELEKGCSNSLVGEARMGKSSTLAMICKLGPKRLSLPSDAFIYLDMQVVHDEHDFFEAICDSLRIAACRGFKLARTLRGKRYILCLDEIEKLTKEQFSGNEREELRGLADGSDAPFKLVIASRVPLENLFS